MLTTVAVTNYRSLHDLRLRLGAITVITGANGTGKSGVYRALRLLADCASGRVIGSLAREGGLSSVLWAGPEQIARSVRSGEHPVQGTRRSGPVNLQLGFAADDLSYLIDLGLPQPSDSAFGLDPEIKRELVWSGPVLRPATTLVRRRRGLVEVRDDTGPGWMPYDRELLPYESLLTEVVDPYRAPELIALRRHIESWRFYDHLRTDAAAPGRVPQLGTRTPVLDHDGRDLAAALQTIIEVGDATALHAHIADAFPGSHLQILESAGRFDVRLQTPGLLQTALCRGAVGRHPPLPVAGGRTAQPSPSRAARAERARDQPASRGAPTSRPADPGRRIEVPDHRRHARAGCRRCLDR